MHANSTHTYVYTFLRLWAVKRCVQRRLAHLRVRGLFANLIAVSYVLSDNQSF